jgi:FkbM family methyltransferase
MICVIQTKIRDIFEKENRGTACEPDWDYETIERIRDSLHDEASKLQYEQEIIYLALRESGIDKAVKYSPCGNRQWQNAALLAKILKDGFQFQRLNGWQMPKLDVPACSQDMEFYFCLTTFIFEQYRYGNDVCVQKGDIVLDCGACVGDAAIWALSYGASSIHCFEPDAINLASLRNNVDQYGGCKITIVPCAVGKETGEAQFTHDHDSFVASKIAQTTETADSDTLTVPVIRIDDYVEEHRVAPTFIKMDVEGGEMDALAGARETLAKHKPQLAVCLYHKPSDMWTIPELIREIVPEYRFWCRKNNPECEFVLYGTV